MPKGFGALYRTAGTRAGDDIAALASAGLSLRHPRTKRITMLDAEGEQVDVDAQTLALRIDEVEGESGIVFQTWIDADTDVVCTASVLPRQRLRVLELSFYGLSADEIQLPINALFAVAATSKARVVGIVVDRTGTTADHDWDTEIERRLAAAEDGSADVFLFA